MQIKICFNDFRKAVGFSEDSSGLLIVFHWNTLGIAVPFSKTINKRLSRLLSALQTMLSDVQLSVQLSVQEISM